LVEQAAPSAAPAHTFAVQVALRQSPETWQAAPLATAEQVPAVDNDVGVPEAEQEPELQSALPQQPCVTAEMAHLLLLQTPLWQSEPAAQFVSMLAGARYPQSLPELPPQSMPDSVPFLIPSVLVGAEQVRAPFDAKEIASFESVKPVDEYPRAVVSA
jgi:hypothetical protein